MLEAMNVLSLFDGISCARVALGDRVKTYYAAEIEPKAIQIAKKNYPDTIELGDVRGINATTLGVPVDLLVGGSPCTDLSIAKKGRLGLEGSQSSLFWEYVRILRELQPRWFILENVASMPKKDRDVITRELGVEPIRIDAALVSAQSRKRLFWTNIPNVGLPADRKVVLKDILQPDSEVEERFLIHKPLVPRETKKPPTPLVRVGRVGETDAQANRVYSPEGKSVTLSANGGGLGAKTGLYAIGRQVNRRLENGVRKDNDMTLPYQTQIELRTDDKCGTLTSVQKDNQIVNLQTQRIRRLTPIECERLQSLPDNYTEGIPITARYKCLGNAFNVEVIRHILSHIPTEETTEENRPS